MISTKPFRRYKALWTALLIFDLVWVVIDIALGSWVNALIMAALAVWAVFGIRSNTRETRKWDEWNKEHAARLARIESGRFDW